MCWAAIGHFTQAVGAYAEGQAQSAEYKARAAVNRRQAQIEQIRGAYEVSRLRDKAERTFGRQRAAFAEAGVAMEGSPVDVLTDSVLENELDVQAVRWGALISGQNLNYQAKVDRMNAKTARRLGYLGAVTSAVKGFSSLQSGFGSSFIPPGMMGSGTGSITGF